MEPIEVKIYLETKIEQMGQKDKLLEEYQGIISPIGDDFYLRYHENNQANNVVTLTVYNDGSIRLKREGDPYMDFLFDTKREFVPVVYATNQAGSIDIEVQTSYQDFVYEPVKHRGEFKVNYKLINNGEQLGKFNLKINFSPII